MSFLDNLENNLKSLESGPEGKEDAVRLQQTRASERANAQAAAPFAEELKKGPFTQELLRQGTRIGHSQRVKIYFTWLGTTLRLQAREQRLELRPTPSGVVAVYLEGGQETEREPVDLKGNPEELVRKLLSLATAAATESPSSFPPDFE